MREIEVKAVVQNKPALLAALQAAGITLGETLTQRDIVWLEKGSDPTNYVGRNALRIRIENGSRTIFTLKRTLATMDKIEHETEVANADEMKAAIEMLPTFELFNDLTKHRRKTNHQDYEICFDEVEGLGTFIEVEKMCDETADSSAVREELWQLLSSLGVKRENEVTKGYDILMREKLDK
jgi:adenylate cyclase, class 2